MPTRTRGGSSQVRCSCQGVWGDGTDILFPATSGTCRSSARIKGVWGREFFSQLVSKGLGAVGSFPCSCQRVWSPSWVLSSARVKGPGVLHGSLCRVSFRASGVPRLRGSGGATEHAYGARLRRDWLYSASGQAPPGGGGGPGARFTAVSVGVLGGFAAAPQPGDSMGPGLGGSGDSESGSGQERLRGA